MDTDPDRGPSVWPGLQENISKKQKKTFTVQAISNIILSLAVSAGAENEPEWTVTEHMDGAPIYIAPENRLRIW